MSPAAPLPRRPQRRRPQPLPTLGEIELPESSGWLDFLLGDDVHFSLPAYPIEEVVDPTGAGDSFAGGFMGYLTAQGSHAPATLKRAMLYGTVTASFCVQGFSIDRLGECGMPEIEERYRDLLSIVSL